jgi:hypothetical protein
MKRQAKLMRSLFYKRTAIMRYILKAENYVLERGKEKKLYCTMVGRRF